MRVAVAFRDEFTSIAPGSEAKFIAVGNTPEDLLPELVRRVGRWPARDLRIGVYETDTPNGPLLECYGIGYNNGRYFLESLYSPQAPGQVKRLADTSTSDFLAELNRQG